MIDYLCVIGSYIKEEEEKNFDNLNNELNLYYEENEFLRLSNELEVKFKLVLSSNAGSISPIIPFYDLLDNSTINTLTTSDHLNNLRWRIISNLSSILESMVGHISGFEAAGLCVIRKSVFDDLRLKLSKSNRPIVEACSLFGMQYISVCNPSQGSVRSLCDDHRIMLRYKLD
jgi:hypothetical protein